VAARPSSLFSCALCLWVLWPEGIAHPPIWTIFVCQVALFLGRTSEKPDKAKYFAFWAFSEVQGLGGGIRLRLQEAHGSHLGPRIEPEVLYTLILYFVVAHH
jgi:hypothetical protein